MTRITKDLVLAETGLFDLNLKCRIEIMLKVVRYSGLQSLPLAYSVLFEQGSYESLFLSFPWFKNFEETILGSHERAMIYGVEEVDGQGQPLAALVLRQGHSPNGAKHFKVQKMESLENYYTAYFGPLLSPTLANHDEVIAALTLALFEDRHQWNILNLRPLDPKSLFFRSIVQSFQRLGLVVQTYFCFGNWYLDVAGRHYCEYFNSLPKILRKNIPYETRKLQRNYRLKLDILKNGVELNSGLLSYEKIYKNSWRNPEPFPNFIRGWVTSSAEKGWLRLGLLYLNEEAVAAQLWFVHGGKASIYKICYDEKFAHLSVGKILTAFLIQHVIDEDKVVEIDYLSGDDSYKSDWMSHRRERWGIRVFNTHSFKGTLQAIWHFGGRRVKRAATKMFSLIKNLDQIDDPGLDHNQNIRPLAKDGGTS